MLLQVSFEVTQFHFTTWPDHGVPVTTSSLLRIHKAVADARNDYSGPILVHCRLQKLFFTAVKNGFFSKIRKFIKSITFFTRTAKSKTITLRNS